MYTVTEKKRRFGLREKQKGILFMENNNKTMDAVYDASTLGTPRMLILGMQHLFAMFGAIFSS